MKILVTGGLGYIGSHTVVELLENENNLTYETYAGFKQEVKNLPSHRILAINRGENEKCLKVDVEIDEKLTTPIIEREFKKNNDDTNTLMDETIADAYERLLFPSLERECRNNLTEVADEQAIKMFEVNLKPLLMEAPLKNNIIFIPILTINLTHILIRKTSLITERVPFFASAFTIVTRVVV